MSLSIKGKLAQILAVESGTSKAGKEWKKQGFIIDTGDQYNPNVCFSLFGEDKIGMLSNFSVGQEIEVSFNLSSREFNGKWYHILMHGELLQLKMLPHKTLHNKLLQHLPLMICHQMKTMIYLFNKRSLLFKFL